MYNYTSIGDGRADSPGHSAKYGSYTVIDSTCDKVIDFKLVQVSYYFTLVDVYLSQATIIQSNEVGGSYHMEKEGLFRVLQFIQQKGLVVGVLVTDRHRQINKWLRENYPNIKHYYDVWHVAKGKTAV